MVALEDITEAEYIIYFIQLRCQPFRDALFLHLILTVRGFLMVAAFLQCLARSGHRRQKCHTCLCGNQSVGHGFCLLRKIVMHRNCLVAKLAVRLSAAMV